MISWTIDNVNTMQSMDSGYNTLSVSDEELILGSNLSVKMIMKARHHRFISE